MESGNDNYSSFRIRGFVTNSKIDCVALFRTVVGTCMSSCLYSWAIVFFGLWEEHNTITVQEIRASETQKKSANEKEKKRGDFDPKDLH